MDKLSNQKNQTKNEQVFGSGGGKTDLENFNLNISRGKDWYKEKIVDMIRQIDDIWILDQILKCIINITK